jgi:DNA-binding transcriptional regulator YiaG
MAKKQSRILATVHTTAKGLHAAGAIGRITMRDFDTLCVPKIAALGPTQIMRIRESSRVSQAVFAALLKSYLYNRYRCFLLFGNDGGRIPSHSATPHATL